MSSHFNYEIDERSLRNRFKEHKIAFTENAWASFEEYQSKNSKTKSFENPIKLNLSINKNFIMPIVFGAIIIGFSLVLFNFINIKNKPGTTQNAVVINNAPIKKPQPKPEIKKVIPVIDTIKKQDTLTINTPSITSIITPTIAPETKTVAVTPTLAITATENNAAKKYKIIEQGGIYISPSIKSEQIGNTKLKEVYEAIDEKIYFIKVEFTKNGTKQQGYIRKSHIAENGKNTPVNNTNSTTKIKKPKNVEQLETINSGTNLLRSDNQEKELELK